MFHIDKWPKMVSVGSWSAKFVAIDFQAVFILNLYRLKLNLTLQSGIEIELIPSTIGGPDKKNIGLRCWLNKLNYIARVSLRPMTAISSFKTREEEKTLAFFWLFPRNKNQTEYLLINFFSSLFKKIQRHVLVGYLASKILKN